MSSFFRTQLGFGTVGLTGAGGKNPVLRALGFSLPTWYHIQEVPGTMGYHDMVTNHALFLMLAGECHFLSLEILFWTLACPGD